MKKRMQLIPFVLVILLALPALAQEPDPFYMLRLESGKRAQASERHFDAIPELRIASFGFLDNPVYLTESLARLAVAQQNAGMSEEAVKTLQRFVDVESVARSYDPARLEESVRSTFEDMVRANTPDEILTGIETLQHLHVSEAQRISALPERQRREALEGALRREPDNPQWYVLLTRDALERGSTRDARRWIERGLEVAPENTAMQRVRLNILLAERDCVEVWAFVDTLDEPDIATVESAFQCLVAQGEQERAREALSLLEESGETLSVATMKARQELLPAIEVPRDQDADPAVESVESESLPEIVDETPVAISTGESIETSDPASRVQAGIEDSRRLLQTGDPKAAKSTLLDLERTEGESRDIHLALLETAALTSDWELARRQLPKLSPFRRSESVPLFYAAVTLYESGRREEARRLFEAARPRIGDSPLVRRYERLITED